MAPALLPASVRHIHDITLIAHLNGRVRYRRLMPVDEVAHAAASFKRRIHFQRCTLNPQPPRRKCAFKIRATEERKLLENVRVVKSSSY